MTASVTGKLLYGALFLFMLPLLLVLWAGAANDIIQLPVVHAPALGWALLAAGAVTMALGMATLIVRGKGLPMNAYPPPQYVHSGIYRYLAHPIYAGCCGTVIGLSIVAHSPAGLWLVSPILMLGCAALVLGYEHHDLRVRFGNTVTPPLISLPADADRAALASERLSVYLLVFLPWLALYEAVIVLGVPSDATALVFAFERSLPVIEWTELFYASTYVFVLLVPLLPLTSRQLRVFAVNGLAATAIVICCFLTLPVIAPPRPFFPTNLWGTLLDLERSFDSPAAAFPSFHVVWSIVAAAAFSQALPKWYSASYGTLCRRPKCTSARRSSSRRCSLAWRCGARWESIFPHRIHVSPASCDGAQGCPVRMIFFESYV